MVTSQQIKAMIQRMQSHVEALYKKATDDQKYYNGAVDSLAVLSQEIDKLENQEAERKEASGKSRKNSRPEGEKEKVRAIRSSSKERSR